MSETKAKIEDPRLLMIPTHPGVQYHFARTGLPISFLGNWQQFSYWRPQPSNISNLIAAYHDEQLDWQPEDFARLLDTPDVQAGYDIPWLMFNWQWKLFQDRPGKKIYRVAKVQEFTDAEWDDILSRPDTLVVSFYPNTCAWLERTRGKTIPYIPLGLDPEEYGGWTGEAGRVLSVIHSWRDRGWHFHEFQRAVAMGMPAHHVDHLDDSQAKVAYQELRALFRSSRVYLHDGEQEYTITLIEAMMTGMPILSFPLPGIERYVRNGENGFVVRDAHEAYEKSQLLLRDPNLASAMGACSRKMAIAQFNEADWKKRWQNVVREFWAAPSVWPPPPSSPSH